MFRRLSLLAVLVCAGLSLHAGDPADDLQTTTVNVVDENGKPVEGAKLTLTSIRKAENPASCYFGSIANLPKPLSDSKGVITVSYPKYVIEQLETGSIDFHIEHPDFCLYETSNYDVKGAHDPIVLKKGATVKVSGYLEKPDAPVARVYAQLTGKNWYGPMADSWKSNPDGSSTTNQVTPGDHYLRLVYIPKDGPAYFSDTVAFQVAQGDSKTFNLKLTRGTRVEGKLDASVPRPVTNGRVVAGNSGPNSGTGQQPSWGTWTQIKGDGTFAFDSLPGDKVALVALCDGFVSKSTPSSVQNICTPQYFALQNGLTKVEIAMEPTATCKVTVTDQQGKPIKGARVSFSPNQMFGGGTNILGSCVIRSEDAYTLDREELQKIIQAGQKQSYERFTAITDENGVGTVKNLPGNKQSYFVTHPDYELPAESKYGERRRDAEIELQPGATKTVTVQMEPKSSNILKDEGQ